MSHVAVKNLSKGYPDGQETRWVLENLDFDMQKGEFISVMGSSGSGKSSLLNCIGALDTFDKGDISIGDYSFSSKANRDKLSIIRSNYIGFIFQNHYLMPDFTVLENVVIPMLRKGLSYKEAKSRAEEILSRVGILERSTALPAKISGGESQRAAVARALVTEPDLILADEPTGNLDEENTHSFIDLLRDLQKERNLSIIVVTHEKSLANEADRKLLLSRGQLTQID